MPGKSRREITVHRNALSAVHAKWRRYDLGIDTKLPRRNTSACSAIQGRPVGKDRVSQHVDDYRPR